MGPLLRSNNMPLGFSTMVANFSTIDSVIQTMYSVISGPAGQVRNWSLVRSLYYPEARLIVALSPRNELPRLRVLSIEDFIARLETIFAVESFWERETARQIEVFGRVANVLSSYERLRDPNGPAFATERKSVQLFFDDARWWIVSAMWNTDRTQ